MFTSYIYIHQYVGVGVTRRSVLQRDSMYHFAFAVYNYNYTVNDEYLSCNLFLSASCLQFLVELTYFKLAVCVLYQRLRH